MKTLSLNADAESSGKRVDKFLSEKMPDCSRNFIKKLIEDGCVFINGVSCRPSRKIVSGQSVTVNIPDNKPLEIVPKDIPIDIEYQDEDIIVIDKPAGLVVHPAPGNYDNTLVNALVYHVGNLSGINGVIRPGIVHRLDKDTSGLMVIAKNDRAHNHLVEQFKCRKVIKEYYAIVCGRVITPEFDINLPIGRSKYDRKKMAVVPGGKQARTGFRLMKRWNNYSMVSARLFTGRTHQIRVHLANEGFPILGDRVYAGSRKHKVGNIEVTRQMLHAAGLEFILPSTGEKICFHSSIPEDMNSIIKYLDTELMGGK
ncbi:MAG: RluA family pseudouridine synthase [Candidatus Aureabacteria bacterium]|nr:RluA family pseudouridine synthase [Candidatus Auribacterota bacterium]